VVQYVPSKVIAIKIGHKESVFANRNMTNVSVIDQTAQVKYTAKILLQYTFKYPVYVCTLMDNINPTLKVPQAQSLLVKPAAAFSNSMAISKTGS
jgi:hypothetical protein